MRLIRGQYVLTGERVLRQAAVLISNDTIEAVGSYEDLSKQYPQADVLGSDQHWIMPGLVNAHHHSNGVTTLLQGVDDDFLEPWLLNIIHSMRSQDPKKKTLYSIAMLLQSGVTSVVDVASTGGSKEDCTKNFQACLDAYEHAGMRVALTAGVTFDSHLAHHQDKDFLASLPVNLRELVETHMPLSHPDDITPDEYLDMMTSLVKHYQENDRIDVWLGPPGPQWVGGRQADGQGRPNRQTGTRLQS